MKVVSQSCEGINGIFQSYCIILDWDWVIMTYIIKTINILNEST